MTQKIEISTKTIIFAIFFVVFLRFLSQIKDILLMIFISFIFMAALTPIVEKLHRFKVPKLLVIILCYIFFLGIIGGSIASIIPPIAEQASMLLQRIPDLLNEQVTLFNFRVEPQMFNGQLAELPKNILQVVMGAFSNLVYLFTFLVFTTYLILERENFHDYLKAIFGEAEGEKAEKILHLIEERIGHWVRGELILMLIVGLMCYIGLLFLGIPYAEPLALLAGILEIVPNLGPVGSAIPAVLVGFSQSPVLGLAVAALYILVQQLENNLIVPKVMQSVVGLRPVITLASLMVGFRLFGITGAVLSVPTVLALQIILHELLDHQKTSKN